MAKQQIKTKAKVTNVLIVNAAEIEAMVRVRYPHIPVKAKLTAETDLGCLDDILANVRMTWTDQSGDTKDLEVPPDIADPQPLVGVPELKVTCGIPGCPALDCRPASTGPDQRIEVLEAQRHTYRPHPAERLGSTEFEDGF